MKKNTINKSLESVIWFRELERKVKRDQQKANAEHLNRKAV